MSTDAALEPRVPALRALYREQKNAMLDGLRAGGAGTAAVRDNAGQEVIPAGQTLSDLQILQMNWLAEGVQGKLPR